VSVERTPSFDTVAAQVARDTVAAEDLEEVDFARWENRPGATPPIWKDGGCLPGFPGTNRESGPGCLPGLPPLRLKDLMNEDSAAKDGRKPSETMAGSRLENTETSTIDAAAMQWVSSFVRDAPTSSYSIMMKGDDGVGEEPNKGMAQVAVSTKSMVLNILAGYIGGAIIGVKR
jgi:hypothetical protein